MAVKPSHPSSPEEPVPRFDLATTPETAEDAIAASEHLPPPAINPAVLDASVLPLPRVVLGCAPFGYGVYADDSIVKSSMPLRVVRAALRAGVNAFDTAPHYHPSEVILGNALHALRDEFPRESYSIITKAAKYGAMVGDHYYDPEVVRASVERSLRRFKTDYLDVVYLHDVEFVASKPFPTPAGAHLDALTDPQVAAAYGLDDPTVSYGPGDDKILACLAVLREFQARGVVKRIGIAGLPLPVLLRISLLALHKTGVPIDVVQSYSHQTLQCSTLGDGFLDALTTTARVPQVLNAAPLSMGILTAAGGPAWHPAKQIPALYGATREAVELARQCGSTIEAAACGFGYRELRDGNGVPVPVVVGCTDLAQLHQTLRTWADVNGGGAVEGVEERLVAEDKVVELFKERGVHNYMWQSPAPEAFE